MRALSTDLIVGIYSWIVTIIGVLLNLAVWNSQLEHTVSLNETRANSLRGIQSNHLIEGRVASQAVHINISVGSIIYILIVIIGSCFTLTTH